MSGHDVSLMPGYQSKEIRNEMALLSLSLSLPSFSLSGGTDKKLELGIFRDKMLVREHHILN